jgi:hypothetical protein
MKSLAFLEQVDPHRKAAIYAAAHDGKMRNFAYHEGLGECRETFSRLLHAVQEGEIGVILTPDAACLAIETSPGWMEAFIQVVKQHEVLVGDHSHDLVYDLREEEDEAQFRDLRPCHFWAFFVFCRTVLMALFRLLSTFPLILAVFVVLRCSHFFNYFQRLNCHFYCQF